MSNENKKTALPKLRFPEFRGTEGWEEYPINDLFDVEEKSEKGGLFDKEKVITVRLHGLGVVKNDRTAALTGGTNYFKRETGQFIFSKIDLLNGAFGLVPKELNGFVSSSDIPALGFRNQESANFFLNWMLANYKNLALERTGTSSTLKRISKKGFLNAPILLPSIPEQQKIADTLTSLDDLLTVQNAKLEALKAHKRGLMQGLFPAEGQTVPKLRFLEFQEAGEWKKEKLGNLVEQKGRIGYRGYTVADIVEEGQGAISLSPGNITNEGYLTFTKSTFISWQKYDESPEIMLSEGFTVLVKTGYSFGKAALIKDLPEKSTINPQLVVLKPTHINSIFLHLLVINTDVQKQINDRISGGDIPSMSQETISKFDVLIPSEAEQQKIADCLSSLDNRITTQSQKIEALKLHKKGLMQHLFPAAAELTA